jgi:uncharacterized protein
MAGLVQKNLTAQRTYVDTSVWIAVLTREATATALLAYMGSAEQPLITAEWTRAELASGLGIKARRKELTQAQVSQLLANFELWIPAGLSIVAVHSEDFLLAAKLCENIESKIRGGDALHLSVAHRCKASHLLTLDHDMQSLAQVLNMQLVKPNENSKFTH